MRVRVGGTVVHLDDYRRPILIGVAFICLLVFILSGGNDEHADYVRNKSIYTDKTDTNKNSINEMRREKVLDSRRQRPLVRRDEIVADAAYDAMRQDVSDWASQRTRLRPVQRELLDIQRPPNTAYGFNVTASEHVSFDREIEDTRPNACTHKEYDIDSLPDASIIIPFYNEALPMLLRTVHSILNRSPEPLIREIILVDDMSSRDNLKEPLERYVKLLPKTKLLRNRKREGLIRSRLRGSNLAMGQVVIFLDAHTEANVGWLEPMLDEIKRNPNTVVQPFVDAIDDKTIEYTQPPTIYQGAFSWDLR